MKRALVAGSPESTHAIDVSGGVELAIASLSEHRAYLEGLGEHPMADPSSCAASLRRRDSPLVFRPRSLLRCGTSKRGRS